MTSDTLYTALQQVVADRGAATALVCEDERTSYDALLAEVEWTAKALLAAGVRHGDRVAMLSTTRPEFFTVFLGAAAIGAIWVGLGIRNRLDELSHVVRDSEPTLLIGIDRFEGRDYRGDLRRLAALGGGLPIVLIGEPDAGETPFDRFLAAGDAVDDETLAKAAAAVAPMDPALIVYTSGTTGKPKGAVLSHHGLVAGNRAQLARARANHPTLLCAYPINHIACVGDTCVANMLAGGATVLSHRFDPREQLLLVAKERCARWGGIPVMVQQTLNMPDFDRFDLSSVRTIGWGGNPMPREIIRQLRALCPDLVQVYGLTETTVNVCWTDQGADDEVLANTIGKPGPDFPCRIADEDGRLCGVGEAGEIQFGGDMSMLGYWRNPEATAEAFTDDGWLRTGDIGFWREDGNISLTGRRSEMFKSGGFNVYPREVELVLETHPSVQYAAVVARPHPLYTEVGHAFVVPAQGASLEEPDLRAFARERLANYKIPKVIELTPTLPSLPNGKVDKQALRALAAAAALAEADHD